MKMCFSSPRNATGCANERDLSWMGRERVAEMPHHLVSKCDWGSAGIDRPCALTVCEGGCGPSLSSWDIRIVAYEDVTSHLSQHLPSQNIPES